MSSKVLFPTLSTDGWVASSVKVSDYLMSQFLTESDYSQSYLYVGRVSSLPYLIQTYSKDMNQLTGHINSTISSYYGKYFNNVTTETTYSPDPTNPNKIGITLYVSFTDDTNTTYVVGRLLNITNSTIETIINLNNG